jgi:hypothetical protein
MSDANESEAEFRETEHGRLCGVVSAGLGDNTYIASFWPVGLGRLRLMPAIVFPAWQGCLAGFDSSPCDSHFAMP